MKRGAEVEEQDAPIAQCVAEVESGGPRPVRLAGSETKGIMASAMVGGEDIRSGFWPKQPAPTKPRAAGQPNIRNRPKRWARAAGGKSSTRTLSSAVPGTTRNRLMALSTYSSQVVGGQKKEWGLTPGWLPG